MYSIFLGTLHVNFQMVEDFDPQPSNDVIALFKRSKRSLRGISK
jgi:hypothetical protein